MSMKKVLVADALSPAGIERLKAVAEVDVKTGLKPDELIAAIGDYDALLVRSQTQVTADVIKAGKNLQIIGRAGVGVDNIDMKAATEAGIIVVNAPTGNTISAAEHTMALMLALARHIPRANACLKGGAWERNKFLGTELRGKTLGVIGLGNIGSEVAKRARAFEMKVIGFDPFVSAERAKNMQIELATLERIYKEADFITLHVPLTAQTKNMVGAKELAMMKPTARIINAARGGLIDEEALVAAVNARKLAGAAIDVFIKEPCTDNVCFAVENIVVTPHLGASTAEAQDLATSDVVDQVIDIFSGAPARYAVNAPFIAIESLPVINPFIKVANTVGRLLSQLAEGQMTAINIRYSGEIAGYDTRALKALVLGGILEQISEERVNMVNADIVAARRGMNITEQKEAACDNYASMITVEAVTSGGNTTVAGTIMRGETHIVRIDQYWIDIVPTGGYFLFADHRDRPGLIGAVGSITGQSDVNVSYMHLSRLKPRGQALMILALDEALPESGLKQVRALEGVQTAKLVKL
ncbi:D-3-phosphoglycerate dehydrogenase [Dehalogenimonas alkenigignens]|uniref:D-3-phosphoglycerate dehydrogenase n=2 Tax=Dehalogenimonas alkenigignens TaxID=1217799 RepID=A0A0W0GIS0_9CHLR|nr:D-3-phosphoglycerate dehydrogenase [Dehalogenimonas alkenigignens]